MFKYLVFMFMIAASVTQCAARAVAQDLKVDDGASTAIWRVENQVVTADQATTAALNGKLVWKCVSKTASKGKRYFTKSGDLGEVMECTPQELVINAKSGGTKFKAIKK